MPVSPLPVLDDMLQSLLLAEEGEHEFHEEGEEVQELRQLFFPVTRECIYLNHASNGPLPRPVVHTLQEYLADCSAFGGVHKERWDAYRHGAYRRLASLMHARPEQIALLASTGDALMTLADSFDWQKGDVVVSAEGEFPSNVYPWLNLAEAGVQVRTVPAREHRILAEDVIASIDERTRLVSLSLVEFSTGYRNDIAQIVAYCHQHGVLCGIDAFQALGALEVNVQELAVDFLAAAAHKWLLAPQATGILYVSDELAARLHMRRKSWLSMQEPFDFFAYEQPLKSSLARFEHSANKLPNIGLDAALGVFECLDGGMQAVEARILGLTAQVIEGLQRLEYPLITPVGEGERSGIVCFLPHPAHAEQSVQQIGHELAVHNIYVSARPHDRSVRIAPHFYNTPEEIDALLNVLEELKRPRPAESKG
ncbi:aminotransferase class V-fold PLP-dependent enzyme [Ktedonosporobacter rubrisoli]|uniref:Aminotransferase class V-fold PLP-dependent enzyme n=1 Tax=Ktedonosporobacter rubrisoli TaxID=2509675 RepID=A0A4P6K048_KTERU|nr:aminotransferase class V-fold PLP-dependent enzyme [Ktedonosporobacter rubrisoli]QBD80990.1 aminotransferase class V-fold PLP-dependent enzyme [Ktedonosporobacter rubrisoli]